MARMVVIYNKPPDPAAFEKHYFEKHIPLAKALPGIRKYEVSHGPIKSPAGPTEAWLVGTLHFDSMEAIMHAFSSEAGQACAADRRVFAPDPSSFQMLIFDDREV